MRIDASEGNNAACMRQGLAGDRKYNINRKIIAVIFPEFPIFTFFNYLSLQWKYWKKSMKKIIVEVAEMRLSRATDEVLMAPSLGSCVAVSIFDPAMLAGGILIFMLPKMADVTFPGADRFTFMFGDTGIPAFLNAAASVGMEKSRLQIALAGGGQMAGQSESFNVGLRNCRIAKELIRQAGLSIHMEQLGGIYNRSMQLEMAKGAVAITTIGQEVCVQ